MTTTPPALLDTDMLSEVMRARDPHVLDMAKRYLAEHGRFTFSIITRYEILRGLKAREATRQNEVSKCLDTRPLKSSPHQNSEGRTMVFDYRSAADRVRIQPEDLVRLTTMARVEFPSDEMMVELHVLRTILAVERGDVTIEEILRPRAAA